MSEKEQVAVVIHYFSKIGVAILRIDTQLKVGDKIEFASKQPFVQDVASMQIEHNAIQEANPGQEIGMRVNYPVHTGVKVYKG